MGFAEKKVELLKIVADADEDLTAKLIDFAQKFNQEKNVFTEAELTEFHKRRENFLQSPGEITTWEEASARIRNKIQK